jgi:hypothetical protein
MLRDLYIWLEKNSLMIVPTVHGYTEQGWLWVADLVSHSNVKRVEFKQNRESVMLEPIRGLGKSPNEAVISLINDFAGWVVVITDDINNDRIEIDAPRFDISEWK